MKHFSQFISLIVIALLAACDGQQRDRNGVLSENSMVDVLYDYQLAMALASEDAQDGNLAEVEYRYTQGVMKKYGITDDEFNISLAHYAREPKQMLAITEKVSKRFASDVVDGEAVSADIPFGAARDTVVIWKNSRGLILSANHNNRMHCEIPVQNSVSAERLVFSFNTNWIYRENAKSGGVMIAATFDNDSTATYTETIRDFSNKQNFSIPVPPTRKVKRFEFHINQNARWQKEPQLLSVSNITVAGISAKNSSSKNRK